MSEEDTQKQLDRLDGIEPSEEVLDVVASPVEETPVETPASKLSFEEWLGSVDDDYKNELQNRIQHATSEWIHNEYGELTPIIDEIQANPELKKALSKLTNKELREFLLNDAVAIWESTNPAPAKQEFAIPKEIEDRLSAAENELSSRKRQEQEAAYFNHRQREVEAMKNEYPELRFEKLDNSDAAFKKFSYIVDRAEERTTTNMARGINKTVSYKEVYDELRAIEVARPSTTKIENTSQPADPRNMQAPRNAVESQQQKLERIKKAGGFKAIAARESGY